VSLQDGVGVWVSAGRDQLLGVKGGGLGEIRRRERGLAEREGDKGIINRSR
jgi:hypothetical protein